jgi:hypothetical protein
MQINCNPRNQKSAVKTQFFLGVFPTARTVKKQLVYSIVSDARVLKERNLFRTKCLYYG